MDCPEHEILLRFLDRDPTSISDAVHRHIEQCGRCQQDIESLRSLDETLRNLMPLDAPLTGANCPDAMTLAVYMDGKLSTSERDLTERHLGSCDLCLDEVVAAVERSDWISAKSQPVPAYLLQKAVALEQSVKLAMLPKTKGAFDVVLLLLKDTVQLVNSSSEWFIPLPMVVPAVRGTPGTRKASAVRLQKEVGSYKVELDIEQTRSMQCQIGINVKEKDGNPAEDIRVSLSTGDYELASYLTRQGRAVFDEIPRGEYGLALSDRYGSVGTIRLNIEGQRS
jgi:hypothetical protein